MDVQNVELLFALLKQDHQFLHFRGWLSHNAIDHTEHVSPKKRVGHYIVLPVLFDPLYEGVSNIAPPLTGPLTSLGMISHSVTLTWPQLRGWFQNRCHVIYQIVKFLYDVGRKVHDQVSQL